MFPEPVRATEPSLVPAVVQAVAVVNGPQGVEGDGTRGGDPVHSGHRYAIAVGTAEGDRELGWGRGDP